MLLLDTSLLTYIEGIKKTKVESMMIYLNKYIFNHLEGLNEYLHEPEEQIIMGLLTKYEMK